MDTAIGEIVPNWTARLHPLDKSPYHELQGQYCRLELLNSKTNDSVIQQLYDVFKPTEDMHFKYLRYGPFSSAHGFKQLVYDKEKPSSDTILYTIFVNNKPVGFFSYSRINPEFGTIEIGHVNFSQELVRTRQATESVFLLLQLAFDTLGYRRVEWKCNVLNLKSRRAAIRYGFQFEGIWLKAEICKGRSRDNAWFSIVDDEWIPIKQEFQRWLSPKNFDTNEQQLSKLNCEKINPRKGQITELAQADKNLEKRV